MKRKHKSRSQQAAVVLLLLLFNSLSCELWIDNVFPFDLQLLPQNWTIMWRQTFNLPLNEVCSLGGIEHLPIHQWLLTYTHVTTAASLRKRSSLTSFWSELKSFTLQIFHLEPKLPWFNILSMQMSSHTQPVEKGRKRESGRMEERMEVGPVITPF